MPSTDPRGPRGSSRRRLPLLPLLLSGTLAGCLGAGARETRDVVWLVQHGRFEEAHLQAQERLRRDPDDPELQALARDAEIAWLLDQGRRAVFSRMPERGLDHFLQALAVDPGNEYAKKWLLKTRVQLAEEALDEVVEIGVGGDLDRAEELCERVLFYLPERDLDERIALIRVQAKDLLQRVLLTKNYRITRSRSYFDEGIESLGEYLLQNARREFTISGKYDPDFDSAGEKRGEVEEVLAQERLAIARGLEEEGHYSAARNEYRMVLLIDGDDPDAKAGLDRMDREVRVRRTLARAEMDLMRGDLEEAAELLGEADRLTEFQADEVGKLSGDLEDARYRGMYERAIGLEKQGRYPDAVEAYGELLDEAEFYEDAISRRKTLRDFIDLAEELYAEAEAAGDVERQRALLAEIQVFWPEYLDVEERLAALPPPREPIEEDVVDPSAEGAPGEEPEAAPEAREEAPAPETEEVPEPSEETADDPADGETAEETADEAPEDGVDEPSR